MLTIKIVFWRIVFFVARMSCGASRRLYNARLQRRAQLKVIGKYGYWIVQLVLEYARAHEEHDLAVLCPGTRTLARSMVGGWIGRTERPASVREEAAETLITLLEKRAKHELERHGYWGQIPSFRNLVRYSRPETRRVYASVDLVLVAWFRLGSRSLRKVTTFEHLSF